MWYAGLETLTQGIARATSHRVLAPPAGSTPRYSLPFSQSFAQNLRLSEHVLDCTSRLQTRMTLATPFLPFLSSILVPPEILQLREQRAGLNQQRQAVNFTEYKDSLPNGQVHLVNRCKYATFLRINRVLDQVALIPG